MNPLTDSRVRKAFKHINVSLGYRPGYFTEGHMLHMCLTHMFQYKTSRGMEHGHQIVCGATFNLTMLLVRDWQMPWLHL